jgi:N-acyl-D-aspartate/D-glutamate deacylase
MGDEATEREATAEEIRAMQDVMRQAMREGAIGYSVNRNPGHFREDGKPLPSRIASEDEIVQVAGVLSEFSAGVVQHSAMGGRRLEHIDWVARIGAASGRPVIWSGVSYQRDDPDFWRQQIERLEPYFQEGLRLYGNTNIVPFANRFSLRNSQFFDILPTGMAVLAQPFDERRRSLADPEVRAALRTEMDPGFATRIERLKVLQPRLPENQALKGKTIAEVTRLRGAPDALDAMLDLSLEEDLETMFLSSTPIEDPMGEIVRSPYTIVGQSDAGAHVQYLSNFGVCTTLLGHYVRERRLLSLEEAVRQLTFNVASIFGIRDRGLIWPGWAADLVLFDPDTVDSQDVEEAYDYPGGFRRVLQHARGVHCTIVNGEVLIEEGEHTGAYPGRVIRNAYAEAQRSA